ncbi:hypothetical protein [Kitasatospora cinereorecta]|uniref:PE-PGRS family protein n=1 Tax=Kitasatospora cinereorecta TaxID=285560 RepID=A0ABW0V7K2_9ACTN
MTHQPWDPQPGPEPYGPPPHQPPPPPYQAQHQYPAPQPYQPQPPYPPQGWQPHPQQPPYPQGPPQPWQGAQQFLRDIFAGGPGPAAPPGAPPAFMTANNPIIGPRPLSRLDNLIRRPTGAAATVILYVAPSGELIPNGSARDQRNNEPVWRVYRSYYEVDMGRHPMQVHHSVPSEGDALHFTAVVDLTWQVVDPIQVVRQRLSDVRAAVEPLLLSRLRAVTRRFDIESSADAEEAVNKDLAAAPIGGELGLQTTALVRLSLDQQSTAYLARLREQRRALTTTVGDHELDRLKQIHRQQLTAAAASFYAGYLETGDVARLALQLAEHPGEAASVIGAMNERERSEAALRADVLRQMIERGHIQPHEFETPLDGALEHLQQIMRLAPGHTAALPSHIPPMPSAPPPQPGHPPTTPPHGYQP